MVEGSARPHCDTGGMEMQRSRTLLLAVTAGQLLLWPGLVRADWPVSPLVNVPVCTAPGDQTLYAVVSDGLGGMIAVWQDTRNGTYDIYAQRLNAAGVPLWASNGVPVCVATGDQLYPEAVPDNAGGVIITWEDFRGGSAADIYAQRIDASGEKQWAPGGVALCASALNDIFPKVVPDGAGGAVVVWSRRDATSLWVIAGQRVSSDGTPQWGPDGVPLIANPVELQQPAISPDDSSGVLLAFKSTGSFGVHPRVQRLDGSGLLRWGPDGIELAGVSWQTDPVITRDGAGGAIVAWADYRDGNGATGTTYAQRVSSAGIPLWQANGVALASPSGDQQYQAVVGDGAGGAVVVWSDLPNSSIRTQRVSPSGTPAWSLSGVLVCSVSTERQPFWIQSDGAGGVLIPWFDFRNGDGNVYVQHVNVAGEPMWAEEGVAPSTANYLQSGARLIPDGAGGVLVAWCDYRGGTNWDVWAQNISAAGTLGGSTLDVGAPRRHATLTLRRAGPNPAGGALAVDCSIPAGETAMVSLFDVAGRCLESQTLPGGVPGMYRVTFAAAQGERAPGVYLVRVVQGGRSATTRLVSLD